MNAVFTRRALPIAACLVICIGIASSVQAAAVLVTNCAVAPWSNSNVSFNDTTADLTLQCSITAQTVTIRAHSIRVDGSAGGSITTTGTGGMKLDAWMNTSSNPACLSPEDLTGTITVTSAFLQDNNSNGGVRLRACGNININEAAAFPKPTITAGNSATFEATCYGTQCSILASDGIFNGNRILWTSQGDLDIQQSSFYSQGGRPLQRFWALHGSILAGGCDLSTPLPNGPLTIGDACNLCQLCHGKNAFGATNESNFAAFAEKIIDLSDACIRIAESITIYADQRNPDTALAAGTNYGIVGTNIAINLDGAEIRNDFGKTGELRITAHPKQKGTGCATNTLPCRNFSPDKDDYTDFKDGNGVVSIDDSVLINDGKNGGGVSPTAVALINNGNAFVAGDCSANTPLHCQAPFGGDAIPQRGWVADPAGRAAHTVIGLPRCDS